MQDTHLTKYIHIWFHHICICKKNKHEPYKWFYRLISYNIYSSSAININDRNIATDEQYVVILMYETYEQMTAG
jgi:hypothetical protein